MNAMNYINVTSRLAYYDAMKATAPARAEVANPTDRLRKLLRWTPKKQRRVVLAPVGGLNG
jgi:hypothetical protein